MKRSVLFVCVKNAARSQMAEAFLRTMCPNEFEVTSAGLEPGQLDPLAVAAMREVGIDISTNETKSVFDLFKHGKLFSYVITVCDETNAERCPIFPGSSNRLHWAFADPGALEGSWESRLTQTRVIRDEIRSAVSGFCSASCAADPAALSR